MGFDRLVQLEERNHFWILGKRRAVLDLLRPLSPRKLLDVGCGTGALLAQIASEEVAVAGVDLLAEAVGRCRARVPGVWVARADGARLPFAAEAFDTALALDVMEHLPEGEALPREAFRVLAPGGVLVASVPAFRCLTSDRDREAGHHRRYGRAEFAGTLEAAGFKVRYLNFFNVFLFPVLVVARRLGLEEGSPGRLLNALCGWVLRVEVSLARRVTYPWGSTLIAVAEKPRA